MEVVAVLGASSDSSRYSYKAIEMLKEYGHQPIPINPREEQILGYKVVPAVSDLVHHQDKIDTLTVYVNPAISIKFEKDIIQLAPKRVIFNPGAENPTLEKNLKASGIKVENACTLVLLRTHQF
jgi:predicted CoA-binding protein